MSHAKYLILFIVALSFKNHSKAQSQQLDVEAALEAIFALPESNLNYDELYERFLLLYENPIDLNSTNYLELKSLHAFSDDEINSILTYRDSVDHIRTIYELGYIAQIDKAKLMLIRPFISVSIRQEAAPRELLASIISNANAYLITRFERRIEKSKGYSGNDSDFAGDPNKFYLRYRNTKPKSYSLGLTTEIDPGESFIFDKKTFRRGMDFWSAHLMIENQKKFAKVLIGDYQLQFGQGLIFNTGLGIGKGAETINTIERVYNGIKPYTSVIEGGFLRGAAATYDFNKKVSITGFVSSLRQDATIRTDLDSSSVFSSLQFTGLHRTKNELARKKRVNESILGLNLILRSNNLDQIGLLWQTSKYSLDLNRGNSPSTLFEFSGRNNMNLSAYFNRQLRQFRAFGELGLSKNGAPGGLLGIAGKLAPQLQTAILFRYYDKSFHSLRGGAFGEGNRNINESGIYLGLKYTFNSKFFVTAYYDRFSSQWLQFRTQSPSKGYDYLVRLNYRPLSRSQFYFQYRLKQKDRNFRADNQLFILPGTSRRFIFHFDFKANQYLNLRSKVQWSTYEINKEHTTGIAFFQDANIDFGNLKLSGRFSIFDTEGGDNRQYAYERDVLYAFSIPGLSGKGIRNYLLIQYSPIPKIDFWIKFSRTTFFDRDSIGSGVDQIEGNKITNLKFQTMIKF